MIQRRVGDSLLGTRGYFLKEGFLYRDLTDEGYFWVGERRGVREILGVQGGQVEDRLQRVGINFSGCGSRRRGEVGERAVQGEGVKLEEGVKQGMFVVTFVFGDVLFVGWVEFGVRDQGGVQVQEIGDGRFLLGWEQWRVGRDWGVEVGFGDEWMWG